MRPAIDVLSEKIPGQLDYTHQQDRCEKTPCACTLLLFDATRTFPFSSGTMLIIGGLTGFAAFLAIDTSDATTAGQCGCDIHPTQHHTLYRHLACTVVMDAETVKMHFLLLGSYQYLHMFLPFPNQGFEAVLQCIIQRQSCRYHSLWIDNAACGLG